MVFPGKQQIGIFSASQFEFESFAKILERPKTIRKRKPLVICGNLKNWSVVFIKVDPGVKVSLQQLEKLMYQFRFDLALVVGFAGGLTSELKVGDLVLSYFHGPMDPSVKELRNRVAALLIGMAQKLSVTCIAGRTASSQTFLATREQKKDFRKLNPDSIAVDMENDKLEELFLKHQIPALSLRAISDSFKQNFDWKKWHELNRLQLTHKIDFFKFGLFHPLQAAYFLCTKRRLTYARNKYTALVKYFINGLEPFFPSKKDHGLGNLIKACRPSSWENQ